MQHSDYYTASVHVFVHVCACVCMCACSEFESKFPVVYVFWELWVTLKTLQNKKKKNSSYYLVSNLNEVFFTVS